MKHRYKRKPPGGGKIKLAVEHTGFYPYLNNYLEYRLMNNYSADTNRRQDSNLRQFIVWCEQRSINDPREVTRPILERYKKHLYYSRKSNGEPLSFNAQAVSLSSLKRWFSWMTQENYLLYNPAADIALPKRPKQLPRSILSVEDVQDLINAPDVTTAEGLRDRAVMEIIYGCGLRRQEAGQLQLHDIDIKRRTLLVREGKGGKDRFLPLGERALQWLRVYLDEARPQLIRGGDEYTVFITNYGEPYRGDAIGRLVKRYLKQQGIDIKGSAHLLRHAMATHMLENGADIRYIQVMLGHEDLRSTQVYTRVSMDKLRQIHAATHPASCKRQNDQQNEGQDRQSTADD